MAHFWIRLRATEIHLPIGEVLIGRGHECFFRIDEPMVSRRHARLRITPAEVMLEDLGSRNGSMVNGVRVGREAAARLRPGDLITVGTQELTLECDEDQAPAPTGARLRTNDPGDPSRRRTRSETNHPISSSTPTSRTGAPPPGASAPGSVATPPPATTQNPSGSLRVSPSGGAPTLDGSAVPPFLPGSSTSLGHCSRCGAPQGDAALCPRCGQVYRADFSESPVTTTGRGSSYKLFWALSDKMLHLGRIDEAEKMMGPRLAEMLLMAEKGQLPDENVISETLRRGLRLAAATGHDPWYAWIFNYVRVCRYSVPLVFLDEIYAQLFKHRPAIGQEINAYARTLTDENLIRRLSVLRRYCSD